MLRKVLIGLICMLVLAVTACTSGQSIRQKSAVYLKYESEMVTEDKSVASPSGVYMLEMITKNIDDIPLFSFCIREANRSVLVFESEDDYRVRDTYYLLWGEDDTVWVYSGDLGTFYWEKHGHEWVKKSYYENRETVNVPEALRELEPQSFTKGPLEIQEDA